MIYVINHATHSLSLSLSLPIVSVLLSPSFTFSLSLLGCLLCWGRFLIYDNESQLYHH